MDSDSTSRFLNLSYPRSSLKPSSDLPRSCSQPRVATELQPFPTSWTQPLGPPLPNSLGSKSPLLLTSTLEASFFPVDPLRIVIVVQLCCRLGPVTPWPASS